MCLDWYATARLQSRGISLKALQQNKLDAFKVGSVSEEILKN